MKNSGGYGWTKNICPSSRQGLVLYTEVELSRWQTKFVALHAVTRPSDLHAGASAVLVDYQ